MSFAKRSDVRTGLRDMSDRSCPALFCNKNESLFKMADANRGAKIILDLSHNNEQLISPSRTT